MAEKVRVILAEKPSMGRAIAEGLGIKGSGKTHIEGVDPNGIKTICTWGIGHLVEGVEPEKYNKDWEKWTWDVLPMIPSTFKYEVISKTKDQFDAIKAVLARGTELVVATDAGREGELIAGLILDKAKCKLPALRLWTKSLTPEAVREAYGIMKPWSAYQGLKDAAYGRSMADWLVGMTGSRAMTLRARGLGRTERGAWPVGRVMTPTLAILVDRELEIRNFVPKDYFVLEGAFSHPAGTYTGKWFRADKDRFEKAEEAQAILADLQGRPARVAKFETKKVPKGPEQFYDLTTLQKEANKRFGFSADKTLDITQSLYEMKVLSYPRTGSRYLTHADAAKIPNWLKAVKTLEQYAGFVGEIKSTSLSSRFVDDAHVEDHTALMPTEQAPNWTSLSEDQKKIYDMVVRRFLAAFFPDRIEAKTVLITEIQGAKGPETFKTTGTAVLDLGWSRVDAPAQTKAKKKSKKDEDEAEEDKPLTLNGAPLNVGDGVQVKSLGSAAKKTTPPKRMTEADLLGAMQTAGKDLDEEELRDAMKECEGLGTPATRGNIIEKLVDSGTPKHPKQPLVERQKNFLVPTAKGIDLILMIPFKDLRSAELTGRWETELEEIKKGKGTLPAFMTKIEQYTRDMTNTLKTGVEGGSMSNTPGGGSYAPPKRLPDPCPQCGSGVDLKSWEGRFYTKCEKKGCYFGYDADSEGNPTVKCTACGGRVKTTPNGKKVCADCNAWQNENGSTSQGGGVRREGRSSAEDIGVCPRCHKGRLKVRPGNNGHFASCTDREGCNLSFDCDETGVPKGGNCASCKGPVKVFPSGKKRCAVCDTWVNDDSGPGKGAPRGGTNGASNGGSRGGSQAGNDNRPERPRAITCQGCNTPMRTVYSDKKKKWLHRCDPCNVWI